jgi:hypothetical protein
LQAIFRHSRIEEPGLSEGTGRRQTGNGEGERAGRWTGFKRVECGIHTFLSKKADFQI